MGDFEAIPKTCFLGDDSKEEMAKKKSNYAKSLGRSQRLIGFEESNLFSLWSLEGIWQIDQEDNGEGIMMLMNKQKI